MSGEYLPEEAMANISSLLLHLPFIHFHVIADASLYYYFVAVIISEAIDTLY
jgi:hypothetical protein